MHLCLVLFDLPPGGAEAIEASVWELSESHWMPMPNAMFVACSVSPGYLASHLDSAAERAGMKGSIIVLRAEGAVPNALVPPEAANWLREQSVTEDATG